MLKQHLFIILLSLFFGRPLVAQNLVPNHAFSNTKTCIQNGIALQNYFYNWFTPPVKNSSSLHGQFSTAFVYAKCNLNLRFGYDTTYKPFVIPPCIRKESFLPNPVEKMTFISLVLFDTINEVRTGYNGCPPNGPYIPINRTATISTIGRSFAQVALQDTLVTGSKYVIEFSVQREDLIAMHIAIQNIGAYLTTDTFFHFDYKTQNINPTVEAKQIIYNNRNWQRVSGDFTATGNEHFLTLGNFRTDKNTNHVFLPLDTNRHGGYGPSYHIDAVYLYLHTDTIFNVYLGKDTTICAGQNIALHAWHDDGFKLQDTVKTFLWSTGSVDSSITVNQPGMYWVTVTYNQRFSQTDTILINPHTPPYLTGLPDSVGDCLGTSISLNAYQDGYRTFDWSTGETTKNINAQDSGLVWLQAYSVCDTISDTVWVNLFNCDTLEPAPTVYIPNAFSPNGDGLNDTWEIVNLPPENEVTVLSRWGEVIFSSTNYQSNWAATDNQNKKLPAGVYVYKVSYVVYPGIRKNKYGSLHIRE